VAPSSIEYLPVPQSLHAASPIAILYFPATQLKQVPTLPVLPATQMQSVCSSLAAGALEFAGQSSHAFDMAPTTVEY